MDKNYKVKIFPTCYLVRRENGSFFVSKSPNEEYLGEVPAALGDCLLALEVKRIFGKRGKLGGARFEAISRKIKSMSHKISKLDDDGGA